MQSSRAKRALFPERLRKPVPTFIELTSGSTLTVEEDTFDVMQQLGGGGSRLVKLTMRAGDDRPDHVESHPRAVITRARPPYP